MGSYTNHQLTLENGGMVVLPPWVSGQEFVSLERPDPYHVQHVQQYPCGTRYHLGERTWIHTELAAVQTGWTGWEKLCGYGVLGQNTIATVTIVAATLGENTLRGTIAGVTKDMYAGGYMILCGTGADEREMVYQILSHTLTTDVPAGDVTFTLDGTLAGTYDAADSCVVMKPLYAKVGMQRVGRGSSLGFEPMLGVFNSPTDINGVAAVEGDFAWVQTWGPCYFITSQAHAGDVSQERNMYFMSLGDMQVMDPAGTYARYWNQQAGFLLPVTCAIPGDSATGTILSHKDSMMFLQITR